jgi:SNF2 family DNA or RNA helicase/tRNA A-37 threonylcarbamoyl transferase component Bud32
MARLIFPKLGDLPQNNGEKRTIKFLVENLTPDGDIRNLNNFGSLGDEFIIIPNLEIPNKNSFLEIDSIVITPKIIFVIEVKDWNGVIEGNDNNWVLNKRNTVINPLKNNNFKAKVLKSLICDNLSYINPNNILIQSILVIPNDSSNLILTGNCKDLVFRLDLNLIKFINNPEYFIKKNFDNYNLKNYQKDILSIITSKTKANLNNTKYINNYQILEDITSNDKCSEYICKDTGSLSGKGVNLLRVFNLPIFENEAFKEKFNNKIKRNKDAIYSIGNHPNILAHRGYFYYDSDKFVEVLNYSEEGTLRNLINSIDLTFDQILYIIKGIASGLNEIHKKLIVHRDLKPENILMSELNPQIMNFDLSYMNNNDYTVWETLTSDKERRYLPYELSLGKDEYDFDNSSDLYSLGVITYELLCKNIPFQSPEDFDKVGGDIPENLLPSNLNKDYPKWIDNLIKKTYTLNTENRLHSAKSFIQDIDKNTIEIDSSISKINNIDNSYLDIRRNFLPDEIIGDYKILELLKTGGFSQVYRALHRFQNKQYALKVNNIDVPVNSLIDEFSILNQLSHPNIVKVFWSGELIPQRPYIAMEYLEGNNLNHFVNSKEDIDINMFFLLCKNILSALRYLHEKDQKFGDWKDRTIYHRDIKPENILFSKNRGFILIDFNISKDSNDKQYLSGTRSYMAPDIFIDGNVIWNESADTFSLGVTLYEILYKSHPYPNRQPRLSINPIKPNLENKDTKLSLLSDFIIKSVQPTYNQRFKTAKEMEESIINIIEKSNKKNNNDINLDNIIPSLIYFEKDEFIEFKLFYDTKDIETELWEKIKKSDFQNQYILLSELIDNGQGNKNDYSLEIPYEEINLLHSIDLKLLGLPNYCPFKIKIDADGTLNQKEFKYKWGFFEHELSPKLSVKRTGGIIELDNNKYLLNTDQINLCNLLDRFNSLDESKKTLNSNLLSFAKIKNLALKDSTNSILDEYLKNENVIISKMIDLKVKLSEDETLEIIPEVDVYDKEQFEKKFDKFPKVQESYNLENIRGERERVIFSEEQLDELKKVKAHRKIKGEPKDKIIQFPQELFNPDIIDLDKFSERVKEIGLYKPKFYPFISPYKSEWIPGFLIETSPDNRVKIQFKTDNELNLFKNNFNEAEKDNKQFFNWFENEIPTIEAPEIIKIAEKQLENTSIPLNTKAITDKRVLIIKDNIEDLEHIEDIDKDNIDKNDFIHRYTEPPNLNKNITILEHQKEGIAWLQSLYSDFYSGALLADDMGLGKTLQLLSFIKWHNYYKNEDGKPYLVIAPVSLLENWENEYSRFFDLEGLEIIRGYGDNLKNIIFNDNDLWQESINNLQKRQIFLTTYETVRRKQFVLCAVNWAVAILDEAQKVKTPGTLITNAVKALKSDFKITSTGTPVENTLVDLWCIIDFSVPGLLGSAKEFSKNFQNPLKEKDTDIKFLGEKLRSQIGIYIKRRMKTDILKDLPEKVIHTITNIMPEEQKEYYLKEINKSKDINENVLDKNSILKILNNIKNISDHPYLIDKNISDIDSKTLINTSAKLKTTIDLLKKIEILEEKVIIFAERKETQRLLSKVILDVFNINVKIINGDTPASSNLSNNSKESRQQAVDRFQMKEGFNIIIMSPLSAGFGLNVTKANNVIHYSRHWNPAKEDQATDRVYRIGQTKNVNIYLPMSILDDFKTFDVIIDELLSRKRSLASSSLFPTERAEISPEDLFNGVMNNNFL